MTAPTDRLDHLIAAIRDDRGSGAAELAARAVEAFAVGAAALAEAGPAERRAGTARLLRRLRDLRPSMAPLTNWPVRFHEALAGAWAAPAATWSTSVADAHDRLRTEQAGLRERLRAAARPALADAGHVVTLSWSSTVFDLLLAAAPAARVTVAEARPRCEGRVLAERLLAARRPVRLVTDAQLALAVETADLVLVGADTICRDLAAVNKVGSRLAALAARAAGKPFLVAADRYKIHPRADSAALPLESMDPAEVWPERPDLCANIYFEPVPPSLISLYLTDEGARTRDAMVDLVAAWEARHAAAGL